jgi:translation elongation factor EF-1alpha
MREKNIHINIVIIEHVDADHSTTTDHLIYRRDGINKRALEILKPLVRWKRAPSNMPLYWIN